MTSFLGVKRFLAHLNCTCVYILSFILSAHVFMHVYHCYLFDIVLLLGIKFIFI
jgi:hypothetical protein